jgi:hypothetical protein
LQEIATGKRPGDLNEAQTRFDNVAEAMMMAMAEIQVFRGKSGTETEDMDAET